MYKTQEGVGAVHNQFPSVRDSPLTCTLRALPARVLNAISLVTGMPVLQNTDFLAACCGALKVS